MSRIFCLLILLWVLTTGNCFSQGNFTAQSDSLLNYLYANNRFSGSVMITKNDQVLYSKNMNVDGNSDPDYHIGSISKMFTAVMIYQLVEEGKLALDQHLSNWFPEIPNADAITLQQLLGHQSGIFDLINDDGFSAIRTDTFSRSDIITYIAAHKPAFKPGTSTAYSNSNYLLLGYILEEITQNTFANALQTCITGPLHLEHTELQTADNTGAPHDPCFSFNGESWDTVHTLTHPNFSFSARP